MIEMIEMFLASDLSHLKGNRLSEFLPFPDGIKHFIAGQLVNVSMATPASPHCNG